MLYEMVKWRRDNDIDNVVNDFNFEEGEAVKEVYPRAYHGTDKIGRPVYIERFGHLNVTRLWEVTNQDRIFKNFTQEYEVLMNLRFPACSEAAGYKI